MPISGELSISTCFSPNPHLRSCGETSSGPTRSTHSPPSYRCGSDKILNTQIDPCILSGILIAERDVDCREGWNATDVDAGEEVVAADVAGDPARTRCARELGEVHTERVFRRRTIEGRRFGRVGRLALDVIDLLKLVVALKSIDGVMR